MIKARARTIVRSHIWDPMGSYSKRSYDDRSIDTTIDQCTSFTQIFRVSARNILREILTYNIHNETNINLIK